MTRTRIDPDSLAHIRIAIRIPAELKARFDAYCDEHGLTMSDVIRRAIDERLTWGEPNYGE